MENYRRQLRTVLGIELLLVAVVAAFVFLFWRGVCSDSWQSCLGQNRMMAPLAFFLLSIFRPLLLTPLVILSLIGGEAFGTVWGTLLTSIGATLSSLLVYIPSRHLSERFLRPWIETNLPATWRLIRTQDYKIVFASRWIPFFPFDLMSILFGVAGFRLRSVVIATFLGVLPETYVFSLLTSESGTSRIGATITSVSILAALTLLPLLILEVVDRKNGNGLWLRTMRMAGEIKSEIVLNNRINVRREYVKGKTPVLLLYGFFSSRKATQDMEAMLRSRGHEVITFNLGGLFGVFNTRNIREVAKFIDEKLAVQRKRHGFEKIHVVAHSKGGLVALWWLLKLGGSRYCDKFISMGTPYKGSVWTYLALMTPVGFFWRDLWQMRPGSEFLTDLNTSPIPEGLKIYCFYSDADRVSSGKRALFEPTRALGPASGEKVVSKEGDIIAVPIDDMPHFNFLDSHSIADRISAILGEGGGADNSLVK